MQFIGKNPDKISGQHKVFILEFYKANDPNDVRIFIYLDLDKKLGEPILVSFIGVSELTNAEVMRFFVGETIQNLVRIINEKRKAKRYEM